MSRVITLVVELDDTEISAHDVAEQVEIDLRRGLLRDDENVSVRVATAL